MDEWTGGSHNPGGLGDLEPEPLPPWGPIRKGKRALTAARKQVEWLEQLFSWFLTEHTYIDDPAGDRPFPYGLLAVLPPAEHYRIREIANRMRTCADLWERAADDVRAERN